MLVSLLFIISSFAFGYSCSKHIDFLDDPWKRAAFAAGFGFLASTWLVFVVSWAFGSLSAASIILPCIALGISAKFLYRRSSPKGRIDFLPLAACLLVLFVLAYLNLALLPQLNAKGAMIAGNYVWSDYPFHFGIINSFVERPFFPPRYPILVTADLSYPFMVDFLSAILLKGGLSMFESLLFPHLIFYFAMISFLYFLGSFVAKKKLAGLLLVVLFIFNGNFGAYYAFQDALHSTAPLDVFLHPKVSYSIYDPPVPNKADGPDRIFFVNQITSIFIPQRSAIMGAAMSAIFYLLILSSLKNPRKKTMLLAGIILGLMPLVHGHFFLAAALFCPFAFAYSLFHSKNRQETVRVWMHMILPALVLAAPQLLYMKQNVGDASFMHFRFGWMQEKPISLPDFAWFWLRNLGLIAPLAIAGAFLIKKEIRFLYIPFLLLFITANLIQLAPWDWDTIKLFLAWFLFTCLFAAVALEKLLSDRRIAIKAIGILLLILSCLSGLLSLVSWHGDRPGLYSPGDLRVAEWIKENTRPEAIWITGDAHAHPLPSLTGRQVLMGLRWYLYSHGLDKLKHPVERDVLDFYENPDCRVPLKYGASYVFVSMHEDGLFRANRAAFESSPSFRPVFDEQVEGHRVTMYKINC